MPHVLSAEESDAPGDGTDDPAPDIVVLQAGGITSVGSNAPGDGSDDEPFYDYS